MAVERLPEIDDAGAIAIDGMVVRVARPVVFEVPRAAVFLESIPEGHRLGAMEDLLEHGAAAAAAVQTSAHIVLLEAKVQELTVQLAASLGEQLAVGGARSSEAIRTLLDAHKDHLAKLLIPLTDVNAKDGLPVRMVELLEESNRKAIQHIEALLTGEEDGVLAKAVKQITDQITETGLAVTKQLAAQEALLTQSNLRGGRFEDILAARLPVLARSIGRAERCSTVAGQRARNTGDYVITVADTIGGDEVTIVVEAKSRKNRLSANAVRKELREARDNRGAAAAILVGDSTNVLPDGLGFGQVSDVDFFAVFDPTTGDETILTCAIYMAKVAAATSGAGDAVDGIDVPAARRELATIRALLEHFSKLESCHDKAAKDVAAARAVAADLRADILATLRRLDGILAV